MFCQGKGCSGLIFFSGERSLVSRRSIIVVINIRSFVIRSVSGSRMQERLVGLLSFCCLLRDSEAKKMVLRASLVYMNMASRADPYLWQRVLLAFL